MREESYLTEVVDQFQKKCVFGFCFYVGINCDPIVATGDAGGLCGMLVQVPTSED